MPVTQPLPVTKGKVTVVRAALLRDGDRPATIPSVTIQITEPAPKGATSLTIANVASALEGRTIYAGQYLLIEDPEERAYICRVSQDYTAGTTLSVAPLAEAIPDNSTAEFPARFRLRTSADVSVSTDVTDVNTYDHSVNGDASPGATSFEFSTDGEYSAFDPGYNTCVFAQRNNCEIWIERELGAPSPAYSRGKRTSGAALVTARDEAAPNEGNVSANVSVRFVGEVVETDPTPTT